MKKYSKSAWQARKHDEYLQEKYGENWKVVKRSIVDAEKRSPKDNRPHSFNDLIGKKHPVEELGNPLVRQI